MFGYERGLKDSDLAEIKNTKFWVKDEWSLKKGGRLQQTSNSDFTEKENAKGQGQVTPFKRVVALI